MNLLGALGDIALLTFAVVVLFAPGGALVLALGQVRPGRRAVALGAAPVVTAGIAYLTALVTGLLGVRYSLATVLLVTAVLVLAVLAARRRRTGSWPSRGGWREVLPGGLLPAHVVGLALLAAGILVSLVTWRGGLGSLATVPQEHDAVTHTLVTANIARTGLALPTQVSPSDLLTGGADNFYPAGMHALSALCATFGVGPVAAMNAVTIAIFAVVLPVGLFALASLLRSSGTAAIIGGGAAVASAVSYRPVYAMMHDGGIYANAAALCLTPAVVALLLSVGRTAEDVHGWRSAVDLRQSALVVLAVGGVFWVHPTAAVLVALGVVPWWVADRCAGRPGWRAVGSQLATIAVGGAVAVALAVPILRSGAGLVSAVSGWSRDYPVLTFHDTIGRVLGFSYGGYLDFDIQKSQTWLAVLMIAGVLAAFWQRRHAGLLAAWGMWSLILGAYLLDAPVPGLVQVAEFFFSSFVRIDAGLMVYAWLLVGVGISLVWSAAAAAGELVPMSASSKALRGTVAGSLALLAVVGVLQQAYRPTNGAALATRYGAPEIRRVTDDDRAAIEWLGERVKPGERVMNSANDGSTYLWVYEAVPVVNTFPLGSANLEYSIPLLTRFNQLDTDQEIRDYVRDENIRWVYVDLDAPPISIPFEYRDYLEGSTFTVPPGLLDLEDVDSVDEVFRQGTVRVYEVDESVFAG